MQQPNQALMNGLILTAYLCQCPGSIFDHIDIRTIKKTGNFRLSLRNPQPGKNFYSFSLSKEDSRLSRHPAKKIQQRFICKLTRKIDQVRNGHIVVTVALEILKICSQDLDGTSLVQLRMNIVKQARHEESLISIKFYTPNYLAFLNNNKKSIGLLLSI